MQKVFWPYYADKPPVFSKEDQCFYKEDAAGNFVRLNRQVTMAPVAVAKTASRPTLFGALRAMVGV